MSDQKQPLRIAVSSTVADSFLQHLPAGIDIVRYSPDGQEALTVDLLVLPSFGAQAADALHRIKTRYVQTVSAGVETVQPLVPAGTVLCNAQGVHNNATAEWAVTATLASLKWLPHYDTLRQEGRWGSRAEGDDYWQQTYGSPHASSTPVLTEELAEKTILIVGYGSIGKSIEARLLPFEPGKIIRLARTARAATADIAAVHAVADLDKLLPEADIVILITPLTPETHHLIGSAQLALMHRGALLVNAARGAVVDTDALVQSLQSHHVRAALDVTDPEPLPAEHPLWTAPGLLLTPHIAGSSPIFLDRVFRFVGRQIKHLLAGEEPENIISGQY